GCVMWEMLVGKPPFRSNVHRELMNAHVAKPPPLQQLGHLPSSLQGMVAKLRSKDREARYADAAEEGGALEDCRKEIECSGEAGVEGVRGQAPVESVSATTEFPTKKPPKKWKPLVAVAAAVLFAAVGVIGWKSGWFGGTKSARHSDWEL